MALDSQRQRLHTYLPEKRSPFRSTKVPFQWWMRPNSWGLYPTESYPLYPIKNTLKSLNILKVIVVLNGELIERSCSIYMWVRCWILLNSVACASLSILQHNFHGLLFPISSNGSFRCTIRLDRIAHTTAFVTPVVEVWL